MVGVILSICNNTIRQQRCRIVLKLHHQIDEAIEQARRQEQITVIGQDGRLAKKTGTQGHPRRIELRQVQVDHIVLPHQLG